MPRAKGAVPRNHRHKKIFKEAKGQFGARKNLWSVAKNAVEKGWAQSYADRKKKKRTYRRLWIARINAAAREHDMSYSRFMNGLMRSGVEIDRKALADLAVLNPEAFAALADRAKAELAKAS